MKFNNLKHQYLLKQKDIDNAIRNVLKHGQYIQGPEVVELEEKLAVFSGREYCLSSSSGTDALYMSLIVKGIGPGDAVFTTPFSFIATSEVIQLVGATPIFVDIDPDTFNIDHKQLELEIINYKKEDKLIPRTIIPVDIFGLPANYELIEKIGKKHNLSIIADGAQSFGSKIKNTKSITFGEIGITSFNPSKIIHESLISLSPFGSLICGQ